MWSQFIAQRIPSNPWDSLGLEWQTATPIPPYNFERIPVIMTDRITTAKRAHRHWPISGWRTGSASSSVASSTDRNNTSRE